jgi:hypothetical protein
LNDVLRIIYYYHVYIVELNNDFEIQQHYINCIPPLFSTFCSNTTTSGSGWAPA